MAALGNIHGQESNTRRVKFQYYPALPCPAQNCRVGMCSQSVVMLDEIEWPRGAGLLLCTVKGAMHTVNTVNIVQYTVYVQYTA